MSYRGNWLLTIGDMSYQQSIIGAIPSDKTTSHSTKLSNKSLVIPWERLQGGRAKFGTRAEKARMRGQLNQYIYHDK